MAVLYGTTQNGGANGWGAIFRLSLDSPLQITQQPQPQLAFAGDTATFSVATFGSLPVSYQWLKNGTSLSDGGNLSGSSSRTLTLTNLGVADAAMYSVVVSNVYGAVTSAGARLEVIFSPPYLISGTGGSDRAGRSDGHVQRGGRRGRRSLSSGKRTGPI